MFLLDLACHPIDSVFPGSVYLVGTAVSRQEYRDVDVRVILTDKRYDRLRNIIGQEGITLIGLMGGQYLASVTGLPIDFQLQRMTEANANHDGMRNPLGQRTQSNFKGDAAPVGMTEGTDQ
jgi:hypothetical protein